NFRLAESSTASVALVISGPMPSPWRISNFIGTRVTASGNLCLMCRALLYLGEPVLLDNFLYQPDSALVRQSYMPKMLNLLNLAGFGLRAWDPKSHAPEQPFFYGSPSLPVIDRNLKNLADEIRASCVLAHVRGVAYSTAVDISLQNVHPFQFEGVPWALAHNGDL